MPTLAPELLSSKCGRTLTYMATVGIAELRRDLAAHLKRAAAGEHITVTDRARPIATIGPPRRERKTLDELIAEGRATPGRRKAGEPLPAPLPNSGDPHALSKALDDVRGDR